MNKEKDYFYNGKLCILEVKENNVVEEVTMNKEEFRDFIGYQQNIEIMSDCITLLNGNQVNYSGGLYRLIKGRKLIIDIFEEYSQHFIDAINDDIKDNDVW